MVISIVKVFQGYEYIIIFSQLVDDVIEKVKSLVINLDFLIFKGYVKVMLEVLEIFFIVI